MSNYPIVPPESYSPPRFIRDFREKRLPVRVTLGGCLYFGGSRNEFVLTGQGVAVKFALMTGARGGDGEGTFGIRSGASAGVDYTNAKELAPVAVGDHERVNLNNGDHVQVTFLSSDVDSDGIVRNILESKVLLRRKGDPKFPSADYPTLAAWADFIQGVRNYFRQRGLLEVLTPSLVSNPGMEPELEPFEVRLKLGSFEKKLYLPTSPELHLKQLLANGYTDIFEIKTCYRNEERTDLHEPEFQMLEWYRAYADLSLIRDDVVGLLKEVAGVGEVKAFSMQELFQRRFNFSLTPATRREDLVALCENEDVEYRSDDDWNELFHRLFVEKVEPFVGQDVPEIVYDFPPSMAALARLTPEGFADRFEVYWRGMELANAFHELNDPVEQRRRFENEIAERARKGRTALKIDENFMKALEAGLPPSAGIALGLDRLFMAIHGISQISKSRAFGIGHQF